MNEINSDVPIAITGVGLRTPVGANWGQTCTSVLSGVNRFRSWPHLGLDVGEGAGLPIASPIHAFGDVSWVEKAEELATAPLQESLFEAALYAAADVEAAYGRQSITAHIALPYLDRDGVEPDAVRLFMEEAAEHCIVDLAAFDVDFDPSGHAGGLRSLGHAMMDLTTGRADVSIVGGIDSLLETRHLASRIVEERVKLDSTADGLIPGEGAGFLVLERLVDAVRRGATIRAMVGHVATADEPIAYHGETPLDAQGMTQAILGVLDHCDPNSPAVRDVFVDLNGERGRFQEWALAEGRCLHKLPYGWRIHHPSTSLGDLGAAMGPCLLGVTVGMFGLGRARGEAALLCGTSERGERACALVGAPTLAVQ